MWIPDYVMEDFQKLLKPHEPLLDSDFWLRCSSLSMPRFLPAFSSLNIYGLMVAFLIRCKASVNLYLCWKVLPTGLWSTLDQCFSTAGLRRHFCRSQLLVHHSPPVCRLARVEKHCRNRQWHSLQLCLHLAVPTGLPFCNWFLLVDTGALADQRSRSLQLEDGSLLIMC